MKRLTLLFLLAIGALDAYAGPSFNAVRTVNKPVIDGGIEESIWHAGALPGNFTQISPAMHKPATVPTQVFFLYDEENVYLAARMTQQRSTIHAGQLKRDSKQIALEDNITFLLDAPGNGNSALFFVINPNNAVADGMLSALNEWDILWDGTFESATAIAESSWTVEIRIPLTTLAFQNKAKQEWGFDAGRVYAEQHEESVLYLADENMPYRISDFPRLRGLEGLEKRTAFLVSPYTYFSRQSDFLTSSSFSKGKAGGEITYAPSPEIEVLATVNPDYAQLESDQEIINVTDVPSSYPEKRPFFTASSDFYPGLAVNTRNIADIKAGVKARAVFGRAKYDLTTVLDDADAVWLLGDGRLTDNQTYYLDLIAGMKRASARQDYNVTGNLRTWLFEKRLTAYTWYGTINSRRRDGNEWESVNAIRWVTRTFNAGLWNHLKTQFYDPSIVGSGTLSNEIIVTFNIDYSFIQESGFWRTIKPSVVLDYHDMFVHRGNGYLEPTLSLAAAIHPGDAVGNWEVTLSYVPAARTTFRYRNSADAAVQMPYEDSYSPFALIGVRRGSMAISLASDQSRAFGGTLNFDTKPVRGSRALLTAAEAYIRPTSNFTASYNLEYADIEGSPYQTQYRQTVQRAKLEYGITDRMTLRGIVQLSARHIPRADYDFTNPTTNLTFSWEYEPGSFIHFVYNQCDVLERVARTSPAGGTLYSQSLAIKVNKTIGL